MKMLYSASSCIKRGIINDGNHHLSITHPYELLFNKLLSNGINSNVEENWHWLS